MRILSMERLANVLEALRVSHFTPTHGDTLRRLLLELAPPGQHLDSVKGSRVHARIHDQTIHDVGPALGPHFRMDN
jgi:hypothetical protein